MSALDDIWAIEARTDLSDADKARQVALLKASAWATLPLPRTIGRITITSVTVNGPVVRLTGSGGNISWPLELVNAPIAVPNDAGPNFDHGSPVRGWQENPGLILVEILKRFQ